MSNWKYSKHEVYLWGHATSSTQCCYTYRTRSRPDGCEKVCLFGWNFGKSFRSFPVISDTEATANWQATCVFLFMFRFNHGSTLLGFRDIDDVNLSGWSFLLVFCSNHSSKTHRLRVRGMDRQTDGSQRCLMPPLWWRGHNNAKLVHTIQCSLIVGGSYIWPSANCIAQSTGCNGGYRACGCGACMVLIGL